MKKRTTKYLHKIDRAVLADGKKHGIESGLVTRIINTNNLCERMLFCFHKGNDFSNEKVTKCERNLTYHFRADFFFTPVIKLIHSFLLTNSLSAFNRQHTNPTYKKNEQKQFHSIKID